jgi:hypothetical protein
LYGKYKEFVEDDIMLRDRLDLYTDKFKDQRSLEIAKNLLADGLGPEKVARNTGLSLAKVKALLKSTAKMKIPA